MTGVETKEGNQRIDDRDIPLNTTAASWMSQSLQVSFCSLGQGTSSTTRNGKSAVIKRITIKGRIDRLPTHMLAGQVPLAITCRLLLVQDRQNNQVPDLQGDLSNVLSDVAAAPIIKCFQRLDTQRRFKILSDRTFTFNPRNDNLSLTVAHDTCGASKDFVIDYKVPVPVDYTTGNTTSALAAIETNSIALYAFSETGPLGEITTQNVDDHLVMSYKAKVRFVG